MVYFPDFMWDPSAPASDWANRLWDYVTFCKVVVVDVCESLGRRAFPTSRSCHYACDVPLILGSLESSRFMFLLFIPYLVDRQQIITPPPLTVSLAGFNGLLLLLPGRMNVLGNGVCKVAWSVWRLTTSYPRVLCLLVSPPLLPHALCWVCGGCSAPHIRVIWWEIRWPANTESKHNHWF